MPQFYEQLLTALADGEPFALGIICGIKGSSPQKKGAKALFFADGRIVGTLGGGCLEAEIQDRARRALRTQPPELRAICDRALHRLTARYRRLVQRGKSPSLAITAVARELCGFLWAVATAMPRPV